MAIRNYLGIAERGPENWSISFPALPGVVTTGDTMFELLTHARDAVETALDAMQEEGLSIPGDMDEAPGLHNFNAGDYEDPRLVVVTAEIGGPVTRINVTMEESLVARLDRFAASTHSTRSALLAQGARLVLTREMAD